MKRIILAQDKNVGLDLVESAKILNAICRATHYDIVHSPIVLGSKSAPIDLNRERSILEKRIKLDNQVHILYSTKRKYENNFFFYSSERSTLLSFFGWQHCTNLPIENGLAYFIATILALHIDSSYRHEETTGCIYDFLWDKTSVDVGMRSGFICRDCLKRIKSRIESSPYLSGIFTDLVSILEILSNTSRTDKSIFQYSEHDDIQLDWSAFEDKVAELYRGLGVDVKQDVNLSGFQVDILIEEKTPSRQRLRSAVECKFFKNKVGNRAVNDFARIVSTLKEAGLVERGIIVSNSGFSSDAYSVSQNTGIELVHLKDLEQSSKSKEPSTVKKIVDEYRKSTDTFFQKEEIYFKKLEERTPNIFAIMPFTPEMDDVYFFGIHETARELGCTCDKVDEMEFVGGILDKICNSIRKARIIVAEVSQPNPNVYYELGYAHALGKPVVLITRDISNAPFDIRGYNHIIYSNIRDLKNRLKGRLPALLVG